MKCKIDLTAKFNDQFTKITSYDNGEDEAVAEPYAAVLRGTDSLMHFIQLPAWSTTRNCHDAALAVPPNPGPRIGCSGPKALQYSIQKDLKRLTGYDSLEKDDQIRIFREALYLAPDDALAEESARAELANYLDAYHKVGRQLFYLLLSGCCRDV